MKPSPLTDKETELLDQIRTLCKGMIGCASIMGDIPDCPKEFSATVFQEIAVDAIEKFDDGSDCVQSDQFISALLAGTSIRVLKILGVDLSQLK